MPSEWRFCPLVGNTVADGLVDPCYLYTRTTISGSICGNVVRVSPAFSTANAILEWSAEESDVLYVSYVTGVRKCEKGVRVWQEDICVSGSSGFGPNAANELCICAYTPSLVPNIVIRA